MPSRLIIRFYPFDEAKVDWLLASMEGETIQQAHNSTLGVIPHDNTTQVIILVPTSLVLLTQAKLPKTSRSRLLQAIPYALEDQLAEEVEQLHFAIGEWVEGSIPVAIVDKAQMQSWIEKLQSVGIYPELMIPDVLAIPFTADGWTCYLEKNTTLVRTGLYFGCSIDNENLSVMLNSLFEEANEHRPKVITLQNHARLEDLSAFEQLGVPLESADDRISLLEQTAKGINPPFINLLQGEYRAERKSQTANRHPWRIAALLLVIWVSFLIVGHIIELFYLKSQQSALTHQIDALYKKTFPQATSVVSPKIRLQRELETLRLTASGGYFLNLLGKAGAVLHQHPDIKIEQLTYQSKQLVLTIQTQNFVLLEKLQNDLKAKGLQVNQSNVSTKDKFVNAQIVIKGTQ